MKKLVFLLLLLPLVLFAREEITIADSPTAGILQKGEALIFAKIYRENGMLTGSQVGLLPGFMFGVSFGGEDVVGNQEPRWHDGVEFNTKLRLNEEDGKYPAWVIGFDSQGHGAYNKDLKRYDFKSKGFYTTASKNYNFLGTLGLHAGINYSLENKDKDKDLNLFCGLTKDVGKKLMLGLEYDAAFNDNQEEVLATASDPKGKGRGFLNSAVSLSLTDELVLKLNLYDMLQNGPETKGLDRSVSIFYFITF